ncbi:hypothetical protein [Thomasclavelia cocleata]|uniref:hypothetical protein n=1 Tax=Thomasclavelia cocleata TaxID=69824 RepID=UPI0025582547|nr:hypothetical protein [Thomasclavelia cocleata]
MNLKESYRYANYLDTLLNTAYRYLQNKGFTTTTKQNHLRSKANSEASDEIVEVQKPYDVEFTPNDVIDFVVGVITEKELLANAIAKAKSGAEINIDNAVAMNKKKQAFVSVLSGIVNIKPSEKTTQGTDYKFNQQDGNQIRYYYNIEETTIIDFNRNDVKALIKKYSKECDDISAKLDAIKINTIVEHTQKYDISDTFEDLVGA